MFAQAEKECVVLIVDDSPETLGMLNQVLDKQNMTCLVALEGKQAIKIAQKMIPDIILLDAIMPNMDGFETCTELKKISILRNIPVIFMTGLSDTDSIIKGFQAGGVDYLTKPINAEELLARMHVHLVNARATSSAKDALDSAGQNVFAVNPRGEKIWATPFVEELLDTLHSQGCCTRFTNSLSDWLSHERTEGDKCHFEDGAIKLTAVYIGLSVNTEHLIKVVNGGETNGAEILKGTFGVTKRESEVFLWLAKGKTNREIAIILDMSPRTVNKHLEQLFKKLQVDNRTSAAGLAIQCLQKID